MFARVAEAASPVVVQEEGVVAERRHGDPDLAEVVEVLEHRNFAKEESVSDGLCHHVARHLGILSELIEVIVEMRL